MTDFWNVVKNQNYGKSPIAVRILKNGQEVGRVRLEMDKTYIGRMPENHVVLDDPKSSRSHARIVLEQGQFVVEDQQSENGLYVNGTKVTRQVVSVGDKIAIGDHVIELVRAEEEVTGAKRENQMEKAEEEEWRMEQTVNISSEELQRRHLEKLSKPTSAPELAFTLTFGGKTYKNKVKFEKGYKRNPGTNHLEIRISIGDVVVEKKIVL